MLLQRSNPDTLRTPADTLPPRGPGHGGSYAVHVPPHRAPPYPAANDRRDPKGQRPIPKIVSVIDLQGVEMAEELAAFDID